MALCLRYTLVVLTILFCIGQEQLSAQVSVLFPKAEQNFIPTRITRIEWTSGSSSPVEVQYTTDGNQYTTIATGVKDNAFEWIIPAVNATKITIRVQEVVESQPTLLYQMPNRNGIFDARFIHNGRLILQVGSDSATRVRTTDNGVVHAAVKLKSAPQYSAVMHPLSNDTAIVTDGTSLKLVSLFLGGVATFVENAHQLPIRSIAVHPSKPYIATCSEDGTCKVWDVRSQKEVVSFSSNNFNALYTCAFSPDGELLAYAGANGEIVVQPWEGIGHQYVFRGHGNGTQFQAVNSIAFTPDGTRILSAGADNTIRMWHFELGDIEKILIGHNASVQCIRLSRDGSRIVSASLDETVRQWSVASGFELHAPLQHGGEVTTVDYSPTGDTILSGDRTLNRLKLWKNTKLSGSADSVKGYVKYPLVVRADSVNAISGQSSTIPLIFSQTVEYNFFDKTQYDATIKVEVPARVLSVVHRELYTNSTQQSERDTLFVPALFGANDTVATIPVTVLVSDTDSEKINILDVTFKNPAAPFLITKKSGTIQVAPECPARDINISFIDETDMRVVPQPAVNDATLHFTAIESGSYTIDIVSEMGTVVQTAFAGDLQQQNYSMPLNTTELATGVYFVRVFAPSRVHTFKMLVVK